MNQVNRLDTMAMEPIYQEVVGVFMDKHMKVEYNATEDLMLPNYTYNPASVYIAIREIFPDSYALVNYLFDNKPNINSRNMDNRIMAILQKRASPPIVEYMDRYPIMRDSFLAFLSRPDVSGVSNDRYYLAEVSGLQENFNTMALQAIELSKSNDPEQQKELLYVLRTSLMLYLQLYPSTKFHELFLKDEHMTQGGGHKRHTRKMRRKRVKKSRTKRSRRE